MAQLRTTPRSEDSTEARIGSGARVRGRIHGDGDLVVEGHVEGNVAIRGDLTISQGASVTSETIEAHAVTIAGALDGNVTATGPLRVVASARVRGNLRSGARFSGQIECEFDLPPELGGSPRGETRGRASARR
jgi:cytoskeletal protein CcmA (bactofilin family)